LYVANDDLDDSFQKRPRILIKSVRNTFGDILPA
jgi:hypothetical protein